jgi:hypothetical protein
MSMQMSPLRPAAYLSVANINTPGRRHRLVRRGWGFNVHRSILLLFGTCVYDALPVLQMSSKTAVFRCKCSEER